MKFSSATTMALFLGVASPLSAFEVTSTSNSMVPQSSTAEYSCILTNLWSPSTHPVGYPGNSAHWTDPVLAAHSSAYTMWSPGQIATTGVENVAELGSTGALVGELNSNQNVKEHVVGDDQFNNRDPPQTLPSIELDSTNRYLSVITMVAPSPDWFTGFYNFEAVNPSTNTWYREFTIDSFPWDAGTEEGTTFVLGNPATNPREPMFELTTNTVPSNGAFLNQAGNNVLPMATWSCNLETPDPAPSFEAFTVVSKTDSAVVAAQPGLVDYVCEFENSWTGVRHPLLYPGDAHWSPPVLASHSSSYTMWEEGGMASDGVEDVAETGSTSILINDELEDNDNVHNIVRGALTFNSDTQMQTFDSIQLTKDNRYLSTITMIAPSPDWFSGFYNFDAVNPATDTWYREFTIETYPWDAGTENGSTYSGSNPATSPIQPIVRFNPTNLPVTDVFLSNDGEVLPVATWKCTLQQADPASGGVCFSGKTTVEVEHKGTILMEQLQVGDKVKVDDTDTYERVYGFGHRSETHKTSYLEIHGKGMGQPLEITKDHMVFVRSEDTKKAVPASMVKVGDALVAGDSSQGLFQVSKIKTVSRDGAYAPFTMSGTIVVNGVVSSSYVSLQDDADTVLIAGVKTFVGQQTLAHVGTTPFRLMARFGLLPETYNEDGIASWIEGPHKLVLYLMKESHPLVMAVGVAAWVVMLSPLFLAELLLTTPILSVLAGLVAWYYSSRKTNKMKKF